MTYSIVARDAANGELGVAVQTRNFAVGRLVPWARAGVGAIATQSFSEPGYGVLGLELLAVGKTASEALVGLVAADRHERHRQVAVVDAEGRVAVHTGSDCIPEAGSATGDAVSVQANMMRSREVWPAMLAAYGSAVGPLADRLMAALDAAEAAGGDFRGRQSAALVVVGGEPGGEYWWRRHHDLRVDDHPEPLAELRRLVEIATALRALRTATAVDAFDAAVPAAREAGVGGDEIAWLGAACAAKAGDDDEADRRVAPLVAREVRGRAALASVRAAAAREAD